MIDLSRPWTIFAIEAEVDCRGVSRIVKTHQALQAAHDKLRATLQSTMKVIEHDVPAECWATGPLTGDALEDLLVCPGCHALAQGNDTLAETKGGGR